jgi:site-specific DNA recombinase
MVEAGMLLRVSSQGQEDGYSLQDQERDCQEHIAKQGYHLSNEHIWNDGAQKSWTLNRPGLQAAIQAVRNGEIHVLVVGRYDRFSRVQMQQAVAIYEIEHIHGGRVESADPKEQFGNDSTGVLLRSVNAWRAEQELELIRDRTQTGRRLRAQSGKLIASPFPLYGYLWADQHERRGKSRYVVDHETAPVVQRIFRDIVSGMKIKTLARVLTAERIPMPATLLIQRGFVSPDRFAKMTGDWTKTMILRIVTNPAYAGRYVAFRTITKSGHERAPDGQMRIQSHTRMRPTDDPSRTVLPHDICPAIVTDELFERVQTQLATNKQQAIRNQRNPEAYLLRGGFAVCGYCGANMTANTTGPVGAKFLSYRCTRAATSTVNRCPGGNFTINVSVLDKAVWAGIVYLFSDPKRIRTVLETQLTIQSDDEQREAAHRQAVQGSLAEAKAQLDNATRAVLNATTEESHALWTQQVNMLLPQKAALEKELDEMGRAAQHRQTAYDYLRTVEDWCEALGPEIMLASYEERRYLLRGLKTKVTCYKQDHDPRYIIEWDLARLQSSLRQLLPNLTDKDIEAFYDSNNTYFRHQSADYVPGSGYVAVTAAEGERAG